MKKIFIVLIINLCCIHIIISAQDLKTVTITAGGLSSALTAIEKQNITKLKVIGTIDNRDFNTLKNEFPLLTELDINDVDIVAYSNYPANKI